MFKKCLITVTFLTLFIASLSFAQIDSIAIFTEQVSWTDAATAAAAVDLITKNVKTAKEVKVYTDAELAAFATKHTKDGNFDMIITFGWFPTSLYKPGNAEPDGSVGEKFLQGGDMFLNTADYIFYVSSTNNDAGGLTNMTNSALDMWTDGTVCKPTADGTKYAPSLPASWNAPRSFRLDQIKLEADWEAEVVFGSDGANSADPVIIKSKSTGGRVGIAFQVGDATPRGEVISEIINNFLVPRVGNTTAVKANDKLPLTWGQIKAD